MKDIYREQWEKMGAADPYWAVLTVPDTKGGKWDRQVFFENGEREILELQDRLATLGMVINDHAALDFGCGVGRLSRALATRFENVIAIDISSSMLEEAARVNGHLDNIHFVHNTAPDLSVIQENEIDFIYSNIVLQHMPVLRQAAYLREFCRILKPGGHLVVQIPGAYNPKSWRGRVLAILGNRLLYYWRVCRYRHSGFMEMHCFPRGEVISLFGSEGMSVIQVDEDRRAGPVFISYTYYVTKQ